MTDLKSIAMENSKLMKTDVAAKENAEWAMKLFKDMDSTKKKIIDLVRNKW